MAISSIQPESAFVVKTNVDKNVVIPKGVYNYFSSVNGTLNLEDGTSVELLGGVSTAAKPIYLQSDSDSITSVGTTLSEALSQKSFANSGLIYDVVYGANGYMAITDSDNVVWSSSNGADWEQVATSPISSGYLPTSNSRCAYVNDNYFMFVPEKIYYGATQSLSSSLSLDASAAAEIVYSVNNYSTGGDVSQDLTPASLQAGDLIIIANVEDSTGGVTISSSGYTELYLEDNLLGGASSVTIHYKYSDGTETSLDYTTGGTTENIAQIFVIRNGIIGQTTITKDSGSTTTTGTLPEFESLGLWLGILAIDDTSIPSASTYTLPSGVTVVQSYSNATPDIGLHSFQKEFPNGGTLSNETISFGTSYSQFALASIQIVGGSQLNTIYSLIHDETKYVLVGENGFVGTSTDLSSITAATSPTTFSIRGIVFDGTNYYVAGGNNIYYSSNLSTWTEVSIGTYRDITNLKYNGTTFVATSPDGIFSSLNGTSWSKVESYANTPAVIGTSNEAETASGLNHSFSVTPSTPIDTSFRAGDVVIAIFDSTSAYSSPTPPTNWTALKTVVDGGITIMYRTLSSTLSSVSLSFSTPGNEQMTCQMIALRGISADDIVLGTSTPIVTTSLQQRVSGFVILSARTNDTSTDTSWTNLASNELSTTYKLFDKFDVSISATGFLPNTTLFIPTKSEHQDLVETQRLAYDSTGGYFVASVSAATTTFEYDNRYIEYSSDGSTWITRDLNIPISGIGMNGQKIVIGTTDSNMFALGEPIQYFVFRDRVQGSEIS